MNYQDLFKITNQFYLLTKQADLINNMAKRIMFSLLPTLITQNRETVMSVTNGIVDYKALESLVPGAKELLHYGLLAIKDELGQELSYLTIDPIDNFLNQAVAIFGAEDFWQDRFGGKAWQTISKTFLDLHHLLVKIEEAKKQMKDHSYYQLLMQMVAEMNIIDGLAHNTDSLMTKIINIDSKNNISEEKKINRENKIKRLMHSKQLEDSDDVLAEVLPYLEESGDYASFNDWISKAKRKKYLFKSQEERDKFIFEIENKKNIMELINQIDFKKMKKEALDIINLSDYEEINNKYIHSQFVFKLENFIKHSSIFNKNFTKFINEQMKISKRRKNIAMLKMLLSNNIDNNLNTKKIIIEIKEVMLEYIKLIDQIELEISKI